MKWVRENGPLVAAWVILILAWVAVVKLWR